MYGGEILKAFLRGLMMSLLLLNISLLFLHFYEAKADQTQSPEHFQYNQEIEVTVQNDELLVTQHFTSLPAERIEIQWPKNSESRKCWEEESTDCNRLNDANTAFIESDTSSQSIEYRIPYNSNASYVSSVFATLKKGDVYQTILHITDESDVKRRVIAEIKPVAYEAFDEISYYLFRGEGPVSTLYFANSSIPVHYEGDNVTVYGKGMKKKTIEQYEEKLVSLGHPHAVIIANKHQLENASKRMILSNEKQLRQAFERLIANTFYDRYDVGKENHYVSHITMSLLLDEPLGNKRIKQVVATVKEALTEQEYTAFMEQLKKAEGQTVKEEQLDEILGEVLQVKTSFIQKNRDLSKSFYPFILEGSEQVMVENQLTSIHASIVEHENFYPLNDLLETLAYQVRTNEHSLYVEGNDEVYRFPVNELFYVFNERRYNTKKRLIHKIGDELYMSEANIQRIFPITFTKKDQEIHIDKIRGGSK